MHIYMKEWITIKSYPHRLGISYPHYQFYGDKSEKGRESYPQGRGIYSHFIHYYFRVGISYPHVLDGRWGLIRGIKTKLQKLVLVGLSTYPHSLLLRYILLCNKI